MWNASFKLTLFGCMISICCVGILRMCLVKYDIKNIEIKKPRIFKKTSEECNSHSVHSVRTHNTGPLFND